MPIKNILIVVMLVLLSTDRLLADTYVKLLADKPESDVYINGEISGTFVDAPIQFILPPGEYLLEVKKENGDGSFGYFKRVLKAGKFDTKVAIMAELKTEFPHDYYLKNATTVEGAKTYLNKFPKSKYRKQISSFLEREYAGQATTIEGAKAYLERYPNGRYKSAVLDRDIYRVTVKKEVRDGVTKTNNYSYDSRGKLLIDSFKDSEGYWKKLIFNYNDQGLLSEKQTERKGQVALKVVYTYDDQGLLKEERHYQKTSYTRNVTYAYDSKGNRIEKLNQTVQSGKFKTFLSYKTTYTYDEKNNLIEEYEEHLKGGEWVQVNYSYDESGYLIKKRRQKGGRRQFDKTYEYTKPEIETLRDDQGRVREEIINPASKYPVNVVYDYRESGTLAEKNKRFSDGRRIRYTYDSSENLIEEYYFPDEDGDTYTECWEYQSFKLKNILDV